MENVTRTIYGMYLQTVKARNSDFILSPNSTLNEKFNNNIVETLPVGTTPSIKYLAIGDGGHVTIPNGSGGTTINSVYHKPIHASLFSHIPFIARPVNADLSTLEMSKYRLKVKTTINSVDYFLYYLRVIDSDSRPSMVNVYTKDSNTVVTNFINDVSNLSPVPDNTATVVTPDHTDYMSVIDSIPFNLNITDITEIKNAYQLLTGTTNSPIISEIGVVSGVDKTINDINGISYQEAAGAQINHFINTYYLLQNLLDGVNELTTFIELGGLEIIPRY